MGSKKNTTRQVGVRQMGAGIVEETIEIFVPFCVRS